MSDVSVAGNSDQTRMERLTERKQNTLARRADRAFARQWHTTLVFWGLKKSQDSPSVWRWIAFQWSLAWNRFRDRRTARRSETPPGYTVMVSSDQREPEPDASDPPVDDATPAPDPLPLGGEGEVAEPETSKDPEDEKDRRYRRTRNWVYVLAVLAVLGVAGWLIHGYVSGSKHEVASPTVPSATLASYTTPAALPATKVKIADFVIAMPRRDGHRLNADGVKVHDNAEAFRAQIADQAMHDPLTLLLYYNFSPLGVTSPIQNVADLCKDGIVKDGNVYSEEGMKRYNEWIVLWKVADIKSVREITFQGTNTGVDGTTATSSHGVSGKNKAGYDIGYKDAEGHPVGKHSALERCTQPTGGGKSVPGVKPGKTDNPKDPNQDAAKRGRAPIGGGRIQDPGPGSLQPPNTVTHPPATARVNPAPPTQAGPPAGSAPDPAPAPPKEQPADPVVNGHSAPPGK